MGNRLQALFFLMLMLSAAWAPTLLASPAADRLRSECDALLRSLVQRPYGWAAPAPPPDNAPNATPLPRNASPVSFAPATTPALGLLLHRAGQTLHHDPYTTAARNLARGLIAAQDPAGRIPASAVFGTTVTNRDRASLLPDRSPTAAGLVLLLTVADPDSPADEPLRRSASRAAAWLLKQQTAKGAWPSLYQPANDPKAEPRAEPTRIVRLDTPDYRDSTLALLYASEVLKDKRFRLSAQTAAEYLLTLRPERSRTAAGLWRNAYDFTAAPFAPLHHPSTIDTLATRYALETVFLVGLYLDHPDLLAAAQLSHGNLKILRYDNGLWDRYYPLTRNEVRRQGNLPVEQEISPLEKPDPDLIPGSFGLERVMKALDDLALQGRDPYRTSAVASPVLKEQLALLVCGLDEVLFEPAGRQNPGNADAESSAQKLPNAQVLRLYQLLSAVKSEIETGR